MSATTDERFGPFQFFMLILSIYVLIALFIQTVIKLPSDINVILNTTDNIICLFFFIDFLIRFKQANNKFEFIKWGWIDLLSSIPIIDTFRYSRIIRVIRVIRILRAYRSTKVILSFVFKNKMQGTFTLVSLVSFILIVFGAIAILQLEKGVAGSNIQTAGDALWWSFVTITTVGYGDFYPVTNEGRIIATILMISGVGLFGTFTGFVASWFLEEDEEDQGKHIINNLHDEIQELKLEISELKSLIEKSNVDS